MAEQNYLKLN